jgi:hypothetical protein
MSRGFNRSVVLTQNSVGVNTLFFMGFCSYITDLQTLITIFKFQHCSISAPSLCTAKYVRQYFTDGTLPKPGAVCEADLGPFDSIEHWGSPKDTQGRLNMDMHEEDKLLFSAIQELSSLPITYFHPSFGNL